MTASPMQDVEDPAIQVVVWDPWGRLPQYLQRGRRGILFMPSFNGMWSGVSCSLDEARLLVRKEADRRRDLLQVSLYSRPCAEYAGIEVRGLDGQQWYSRTGSSVVHAMGDDFTATRCSLPTEGWLPAVTRSSMAPVCGDCIRAIAVAAYSERGVQSFGGTVPIPRRYERG